MLTDLLDLRVTAPHRVNFTIGVNGIALEETRAGMRGGEQWVPYICPGLAALGAEWYWDWMELDGPGWHWMALDGRGSMFLALGGGCMPLALSILPLCGICPVGPAPYWSRSHSPLLSPEGCTSVPVGCTPGTCASKGCGCHSLGAASG